MLTKLTIGRLVRYSLAKADLPDSHSHCEGQVIPALVVSINEDGVATLTGFPDFKRHGTLPVLALLDRALAYPPQPGHWFWPPEFLKSRQQINRETKERKKAAKRKSAVVDEVTA